jgi:hypothetical protein
MPRESANFTICSQGALVKKLTQNQITGQLGEHLVAAHTLAMGFTFDGRDRLATGIDGFLELGTPRPARCSPSGSELMCKPPRRGLHTKTKVSNISPDDLDYWRGASIPVIVVLVRHRRFNVLATGRCH